MSHEVNKGRRRLLIGATTAVGAVGTAFVLVPFVKSMSPSARAQAAGAPVEVDISKVELGQRITAEWRGKPVWVVHRTEENLKDLPTLDDMLVDPTSEQPQQPDYCNRITSYNVCYTKLLRVESLLALYAR